MHRADREGTNAGAVPGTPERRVFDASEIADLCSVDVATVYSWVKRGAIERFELPGARFCFTRGSVVHFLRRHGFPVPEELRADRMRVVVIDREHDTAGHLQRAFPAASIQSFADPYDGLLAIGSTAPDGIIVDGADPLIDRERLVRRIRANEHVRHARVIVYSTEIRDQETSPGAAAFIKKPNVRDLLHCVQRLVGPER